MGTKRMARMRTTKAKAWLLETPKTPKVVMDRISNMPTFQGGLGVEEARAMNTTGKTEAGHRPGGRGEPRLGILGADPHLDRVTGGDRDLDREAPAPGHVHLQLDEVDAGGHLDADSSRPPVGLAVGDDQPSRGQ